ncbi:Hypothetical predicted protein [Mytilus galloprovincialis]|uniref:Mab-21-like HhH/H2TH-like domain-containing protein n=1 Tax=Mytilus galloprovincialis TaxID=29158 RepID=A0A8B6E2M4_MYTGA|nr:Hypothetical predicted protein [Mytilus galloprovincialis]
MTLGFQALQQTKITSGSKGEGLQLKGSDLDLMFMHRSFKVYESESDFFPQSCKCIPLLMKTEDTHPCFTQLHLVNNHDLQYDLTGDHGKRIKNSFLGTKFSSELFRLNCMRGMPNTYGMTKIHGPCISTTTESMDAVFCLKCDKWISHAKQWTIRHRTTWPSSDLIFKIISCGVLFVPIGYKGSNNEILQWRMSFSVAEKCLIFSFNHTQLLCYALLKIMIKEIVQKQEDLKSLLCSYFVKTLMFWMLEESDPSIWRPDKIITCFMACLKRLIYCVEYSTLLHYFIPDNNLFYLRFDFAKKTK